MTDFNSHWISARIEDLENKLKIAIEALELAQGQVGCFQAEDGSIEQIEQWNLIEEKITKALEKLK